MTVLAEVLAPGPGASIQDLGRPGARHLGVPLSGAADPLSLALANACLGNPPDAAGLECPLAGPELRFLKGAAVALTGADMEARLNGVEAPLGAAFTAIPGDVLKLSAAKTGARAYIAFAGGLAGNAFLKSVSTYAPAGIGGVNGRTLRAGDELKSAGLSVQGSVSVPAALQHRFTHEFFLRATPGPEADMLAHQNAFFAKAWRIGRRADRMGVQLEGASIEAPPRPPMASSPVFPGTVQCPHDGMPFLLLADAQTVGGYPRIAQVIAADLPLTGQLRPGDQVWFQPVTAEEARSIAQHKAALFADILRGGFFR